MSCSSPSFFHFGILRPRNFFIAAILRKKILFFHLKMVFFLCFFQPWQPLSCLLPAHMENGQESRSHRSDSLDR